MLSYRLTGTTEDSGSTTTNTASLSPTTTPPQRSNGTESSRTMVRLEDGAALLICVFNESQDQLKFLSAEPGHGSAEQHGSSEVGRTSTIGMLLEYLERRGAPFTFRLSTPTDTAGIDITRMALSVQ